jgi:hypothetical protein
MRAVLVVSLVALLCPAAVLAQTAPAPSTAPAPTAAPAPSTATDKPHAARTRGGDITKAEYIERAVERAKRAAEKRFDKLDANRDGVLSADERGAARAARSKRKSSSE